MKEKIFYGIWRIITPELPGHWVTLSKSLGLYTEHLSLARGTFHNIKMNLGRGWDNVDYKIRQLGEDGLPIGEPLND